MSEMVHKIATVTELRKPMCGVRGGFWVSIHWVGVTCKRCLRKTFKKPVRK